MKKLIVIALCLLVLCFFSGCETNKYPLSTYEKTDQEEILISVVEDSITPEQITLKITNLTNIEIYHSVYRFQLEKQIDDKWYWINEEQYFLGLWGGYPPNYTATRTIEFDERLKKGRYRVIKEFDVVGNTSYVDAEFEVK